MTYTQLIQFVRTYWPKHLTYDEATELVEGAFKSRITEEEEA